MDELKRSLSPEIYETLVAANLNSPSEILTCTRTELAEVTKLGASVVEEIVKACTTILLHGKINTANYLNSWVHISTGCSTIDTITKGGIPLHGITEIVGCSGVGKTQMCLQLTLMTQLPTHLGGLEKGVVYICTEDAFPAKRLRELSEEWLQRYKHIGIHSFEDSVFIEHVADGEQLKQCLSNLSKLLPIKPVGLVVIDSIAGAFRSENLNINYCNRSQDFISAAIILQKLSEKYNFAVVCSNQVTDNIASGLTEPCLGLAWSNVIGCRFRISRHFQSKVREFEVIFAPDLSLKNSCKFIITKTGLVGVE